MAKDGSLMQWVDRLIGGRALEAEVEELLHGFRLADDLVRLREASGLSQRQLAQRLGISQPAVAKIESGRAANLQLRTLLRIVTVLGDVSDPKLPPASVDLMILVDVYHELEFPREMGQAMVKALKPGGRIALVEYRAEDPDVPIKEVHKMSVAQARKEMSALGLAWVSTDSKTLPWQHLIIFVKK